MKTSMKGELEVEGEGGQNITTSFWVLEGCAEEAPRGGQDEPRGRHFQHTLVPIVHMQSLDNSLYAVSPALIDIDSLGMRLHYIQTCMCACSLVLSMHLA